MLCDDWNHRSVEKPGSGSSLLEDDVHTVWLFFCHSSYSGALWPRHSFSGVMGMEIRSGLLITKDIRETVSYNWQRCSKVICWKLKQAAHFWDDFQDSVLSVTCRGKKGKALVFQCNNRSTKPRDVWLVIQGQVGKTFGSILYAGTVHSLH